MFGLGIHSKIANFKRFIIRMIWVENLKKNGVFIENDFNVKGRSDWRDRIHFEGSALFENNFQLWFSEDTTINPSLTIGDGVFIGRNSYIGVHEKIRIGSNTMIGAYSYIISANHRYASRELPILKQGFSGEEIRIDDDVWLGTQCVVLPGVHIGDGAIVGAGSVITKNIPPYQIWAGSPAKFIKERP